MDNQDRPIGRPDFLLLFIAFFLVCFGLVMIFSASSALGLKDYGNPWHYVNRQVMFAGIGLIAMLVCMRIPFQTWKKFAPPMILTALLLLGLVLVIGNVAGGAKRWFAVGGFSFQPSEFAKISIIVYLSAIISKKGEKIRSFKRGLIPIFIVMGLVLGLVYKQPDYGTMLILSAIAGSIIVVGGANFKHLFAIAAAIIPAFVILAVSSEYRMKRITSFLNPMEDLSDDGYQLSQSLSALGHGGWTGTGLGQSVQKLFYLPAAHTDFIFSVIAEEFGFLGSTFFVLLFLLFIWRGFRAALSSQDSFGLLLGVGISSMFSIQFLMNIGAVTGSLPITGVTLPFISYGGTSLILSMASTGILLSISRQATRKKQELKQ
ncbi:MULTISPECIES: putative lipid II flippase FtsW [unclassified Paenibacillus]|uniref:putative lipid II flippase FtsW n=1 Tax=unclassified Paenibacillus TaxID=185978 RepID=UPI002F406973